MGEMAIGTVVSTPDGQSAAVSGVYPQGMQDVYRITFRDGRSTECGADHLWRVFHPDQSEGWRTVDTNEIIRRHPSDHRKSRQYIQLVEPEDSVPFDLPLDPYLLGILIGDGCLSQSAGVATPDQFILDEMQQYLPDRMVTKFVGRYHYTFTDPTFKGNRLTDILREIGLMGKRAWEKTIPDQYLHASKDQRYALIQGLMDTDGTSATNGGIQYCTTSLELANQIIYLIRSLGGMVHMQHKQPFYTYKGERLDGRTAYILSIRHRRPRDLFRLPRKRDRVNYTNQYADTLKLRIDRVEYVGQKECQCISVDHPDHLYITDDFVVTHNTVTALSTISNFQTRTVIVVLPAYIEKWGGDITSILDVRAKDVMVIQGTPQLKGLIDMAMEGHLTSKFIIISISTLKNFYKAYEHHRSDVMDEYGCVPEDLWEYLGVGTLILDEVHQHLHAIYKMLTYTHINRVIALSATFISDDSVVQRVQHLMFPKAARYDSVESNTYIKAYGCEYSFTDLTAARIRTNEFGSNNYSHNAFEKSIMRNVPVLNGYLKMVDHLVNIGYMQHYQPGDRLMIFASSIKMCTEMTRYFKARYPQLDVRRYVEDDPYENVIDADIRISTILSSGTAIDIPKLMCTIMTTAIASPVSNLQALGRLRKIPGRDVRFYYLYCGQLRKHVGYHHKKKELFQGKVEQTKDLQLPFSI
jgi:superfamily II DNA or RNA helicase